AIIECGVSGGVYSFQRQWEKLPQKPKVKYLVAMHAHFDHVCGIPALQKMFPAAVLLASSPAEAILKKPKIMGNFFAQDEKMSDLLAGEGIIPGGLRSPNITEIAIDKSIAEGDEIKLDGDLNIKVLDAPGHSPCSLACYLPADQAMFISDACGFQISDEDIFPVFFQAYDLYMETIKKLMSYPTRFLAIPHERIWTGGEIEAFYARALRSAELAFDRIRDLLEQGWEDEKIEKELFARYYQGNLKIYTPGNIRQCVQILLWRVKEKL
ncbi:MAG: MBL fold metallo-hydrolase, partial [Syntrophomonas sp.]|nr:MBL fold metallo-hydrolase [Syntrophomonas sp.]